MTTPPRTRAEAEAITREVVASAAYPHTTFSVDAEPGVLVLRTVTGHRPNSVCPNGGLTALVQHTALSLHVLQNEPEPASYVRFHLERLIRGGELHEVDEALRFAGVPVRWPHEDTTTFEAAVAAHVASGRCEACEDARVWGRGPDVPKTGLGSLL